MERRLPPPPSPPSTPPLTSQSPETFTPPLSPLTSAAIPGEEPITVNRRSDYSVLCKWTIRNFGKPMCSPYFELVIGSLNCRVLFCGTDSGSLCFFLQVSDNCRTEFESFIHHKISIPNHLNESKSLSEDAFCRFTDKKRSHGWRDVALSSTVLDPELGFILNDSLTITADIRVLNELTLFINESPSSSSSGPITSSDSGKFTWTVKNFGLFGEIINKNRKLSSPSFRAEACDLRISVDRRVVGGVDYLSLFLDGEKSNCSECSSCSFIFRMSVLNQKWGRESIHKDLHGRFASENTCNGWCDYMEFSRFIAPDAGFLVDDTAMFSASFQAIEESIGYVISHSEARKAVLHANADFLPQRYVWKFKNFTRLKDRMRKRKIRGLAVRSQKFRIRNRDFRLVIYPRGQFQPPSDLSFYLEAMELEDKSSDWSLFISYRFSVINQKNLDKSVSMDSGYRFSNDTKESDCSLIMSLNSLFDQDSGFLVDDTIRFSAEILFLKERFFKGITEVMNADFPVPSLLDEVLWIMDNFLSFKNILETNIRIVSQTFQVGECKLQIGVCQSVDFICAILDNPSVMNDREKGFEVRYRMALVNQKHSFKSSWKEGIACKNLRNCVIELMKVSDMLDPDAGFLVDESVAILCQILCHGPSAESSEPSIKWPEQSDEHLSIIINSLKFLDDTAPKRWPLSVKKISHILDKAPKQLQLDLVPLVPKLVDHSEHPFAASALIHQLMKPDADPELQVPVFSAFCELDLSRDVWEHVFSLTSKLVVESNDGALATTIGLLFKAAARCQHISEAVKVVRARLCSLGVEVSPYVLNFLSETVISCSDIAKALLSDIDSSFELDDKDLATSGGTSLYSEDEHRTTGLNMMDGQLLHENRHFSDVFTLIEMLSVPSLTNEASKAFEKAVAQGSIVVHLVAMVLERRRALRLSIRPISVAGENQQRDEAADEKIESSLVKEDDFASLLGLVKSLSLSREPRVHQFAQMFYATLFRFFADENYYERMLKGLIVGFTSHIENGHQADRDFNTLLFLVNEVQGLAGSILNMMREVTKVANVDLATLRHQLRVSEDQNLCTQEEKRAQNADMVRENARLLEMLSESEATTNHYKSKLKLEIDRFAGKNKGLSKRIKEVEGQLEWFQSEQNAKIMKLSAEKSIYKDRLHNLERQFSQLKSQNSDDFKRVAKEKNDLAENLKSAESARKRSEDKLKCFAKEIQAQKNVRHSLEDEIRQLKVTVEQLEQEKLDKEERIQQLETNIKGMEANFSACQRLAKEKNALAERLNSAESARKRSDDELKCCAREIEVQKNVRHSLEDKIGQLTVTVEQIQREKLDKEERIQQLETDIKEMEANFSACQQCAQSLHASLVEEMTLIAPLYGYCLQGRSTEELEALASFHKEGLEKIHAQMMEDGVIVNPSRPNHSTFPNSSRSCSITLPFRPTGQSASVSPLGNPAHNHAITPPSRPPWQSASVSSLGNPAHNHAITPPSRPTWQSTSVSPLGNPAHNRTITPPSRPTRQSASVSPRGNPAHNRGNVTHKGPPWH